jgi:hypothetical protein
MFIACIFFSAFCPSTHFCCSQPDLLGSLQSLLGLLEVDNVPDGLEVLVVS